MDNVMQFKSSKEFERWIDRNHSASEGIWLRMFKKDSNTVSIKGPEALDVALCYGWITGQAKPYDSISVVWRFCPRRPKSLWSKLNTQHAERLIKEGRMKSSGMAQIEAAKTDGRWHRAYSPQRTATLPLDFVQKISKNKKAKAFLNTLNRSNVYAIIFRLETTHNEKKRKEKMDSIIAMLEHWKKFH